jgi:hypothetical protein
MPFASDTEYSMSFKGVTSAIAHGTVKKRGNASNALWLSIGEDKYRTETGDKFPGFLPPPPAARAVAKWEPNTLPFHDRTIYRESFPGFTSGKPDIYKPKQQTATL